MKKVREQFEFHTKKEYKIGIEIAKKEKLNKIQEIYLKGLEKKLVDLTEKIEKTESIIKDNDNILYGKNFEDGLSDKKDKSKLITTIITDIKHEFELDYKTIANKLIEGNWLSQPLFRYYWLKPQIDIQYKVTGLNEKRISAFLTQILIEKGILIKGSKRSCFNIELRTDKIYTDRPDMDIYTKLLIKKLKENRLKEYFS